MNISGVVYMSNTGFTKRYAEMFADRHGLPLYSYDEAVNQLAKGSNIIYFSWLRAGSVYGYGKVSKKYSVKAVCGVCLGTTGSQTDGIRKAHSLNKDFPVFTLQGGMEISKLKGINRFMIKMLIKMLNSKDSKSEDEKAQLSLLENGGDYVSADNLTEVDNWYYCNADNK